MSANPDTIFETIEFTLNGASIEALPDETIIQAAKRTGTVECEFDEIFCARILWAMHPLSCRHRKGCQYYGNR